MANFKRIVVVSDSNFFPVFQKAIKHEKAQYPSKSLSITTINKERSQVLKKEISETYKFVFDWQDKDVCGIEVFKEI